MPRKLRYALAILLILVAIIEVLLAFHGPMAFRRKVSIMVAPTYSSGISDEEDRQLRGFIETALAKSGQYRIVTHELIRNYYLEAHDEPDFRIDTDRNYLEYAEIAGELGIDQLAVISAFSYRQELSVTIIIRSVPGGEMMHRLSYHSGDLEDFAAGISSRDLEDRDDRRFSVISDLRDVVRGIEVFDYVFFLFLAGEILLAALLLWRRRPASMFRWVLEIISLIGLLLFLFSYVYAKNAGLDYVQRFIAEGGQINLAPDTKTEQLYAFARFLPMLLVNAALYLFHALAGKVTPVRQERPGIDLRLTRLAGPWGFAAAVASALLFTLSFPSFLSLRGFPALAWFSLVPLLLALIESGPGRGIFYGIAFGMLSTLLLNYWHGTYSYISLAFSVGLGGLLFALWVIPWVLSIKALGAWGFIPASALWIVFEYLRSVGYLAYPWGLAGVSQYAVLPVIQAADLGGVYLISFLVVSANAGLAWGLAADARNWPRRTPLLFAAAPLVLALMYGTIRLLVPLPEPEGSIRIALIQQNTDPRKHDYQLSFDTLKDLSRQASAEAAADDDPRPVDLLVWPEGGFKSDIRYWLERPDSTIRSANMVRELLDFMRTEAGPAGTWLLTGTQDHGYERGENGREIRRNFNSTALLDPSGEIADIYHKIHLVPFTEHFPYKEEYPWLAELLDKFNTSNWKQGAEQTIFEHPGARFFTPICFEDIFATDLRRFAAGGPQLIVNASNDYWSLTPVEGKQHAVHALFRSVENRIPTVRSTASGLTVYIDAFGRLTDRRLPYYEAGYLLADVPIRPFSPTPYQRSGEWIVHLCAIAWTASLLGALRARLARNTRNAPAPVAVIPPIG
jgi:apolipoprotein N-acyltransferase